MVLPCPILPLGCRRVHPPRWRLGAEPGECAHTLSLLRADRRRETPLLRLRRLRLGDACCVVGPAAEVEELLRLSEDHFEGSGVEAGGGQELRRGTSHVSQSFYLLDEVGVRDTHWPRAGRIGDDPEPRRRQPSRN